MAKVQIKSEKVTPFGGIFSIMEQFDALLSNVIDSTLGKRCQFFGYSYSEIIRSLMCVFFCGGSCVEDISTHPLAELNQRIFNSTNGFVIFVVNILEDCKCANLPYNSGKQSISIFRIISHYHELVTQLREYGFYSFSGFCKSRKCRFPVFLIGPVWNFQSDIGSFEQI